MYNMECVFCGDNNQLIKEHKYWKISLHSNQYYLGRCLIILKRHIEDLSEFNANERDDLFDILKNLKESIIKSFGADLFNYAILGNITRHLHMHFIPRYKHEVEFSEKRFKDDNWNKNYVPYPREFETSEDILIKIKEEIKSNLS